MKVNCFRISDGPQLIPCEYALAIDSIRQQNAKVRIDVLDIETSELEEKLNEFKGFILPAAGHQYCRWMYFYFRRKGWFY
jgi:hypothetical protein